LVPVAAIRIHRPTRQDRSTPAPQVSQHLRISHVRRAEKDFTLSRAGLIPFVRREALTELLVNAREFLDGAVEHQRKAGLTESAEQFLAFAQ